MKILFTLTLLFTGIILKGQSYDIYVSDAGNFSNPPWQILKFDSAGQNPTVFISTNLNWPQDILFVEDSGFVLVSNLGSGTITKYDANTGAYLSDFATGIGGPTRMKIGPDSTLYVLQWNGNGLVQRYSLDGTFLGDFTNFPVTLAIGLDWDANSNLYVSSYNGKAIQKFDQAGMDLGPFIDSALQGPTNIWFKSNGDLFVNDYNGNAVKRFNSNGVYTGKFIPAITHPEGVNFLPDGSMLIGSTGTHSVKMFDTNGNYLQDLIAPNSGHLITPNAIVIRKKSVVAVDEKEISKSHIICPSIGSHFCFSQQIKNVMQMELYSTDGKFIQSIPVMNIWIPKNISDGYYFVKFLFRDKTQRTEKIFIRN
jgi:DNA-binding beta-propeller fold protein YncE